MKRFSIKKTQIFLQIFNVGEEVKHVSAVNNCVGVSYENTLEFFIQVKFFR